MHKTLFRRWLTVKREKNINRKRNVGVRNACGFIESQMTQEQEPIRQIERSSPFLHIMCIKKKRYLSLSSSLFGKEEEVFVTEIKFVQSAVVNPSDIFQQINREYANDQAISFFRI